jgi:putative ABC transport system substrate-binding protein
MVKIKRNVIVLAMVVAVVATLAACSQGQEKSKRHFTIGLVTNSANGMRNVQGFKDGMAELGYVEGEDVTYVFEGEPTNADRLDAVIQEMVDGKVDLIFTAGTPTGVAAHRVTEGTGIPVVFGVIADPIAAGVMTDLTRPGGNMTGVRLNPDQARRLELLLDVAPDTRRVFVPYDPEDSASTSALDQVKAIALDLGVEIVEGTARSDEQVTELLANIPKDIDAIFMVPGTTVSQRLQDLLAVALARNLPVSGPSTIQVEQGALTTFGFIHHKVGAQAARIADQILKGADPGTLPVQTAESYLVVNLNTAQDIGLEVPYEILQQAETIIRDP